MFNNIMNILLNLLNIFVLIKTISFSTYEINNGNRTGGTISIVLEVLVFSLVLFLIWFK